MGKWGEKEIAEHCRQKSPFYENLPDNLLAWCDEHYCNIQINTCNTDAINGYGCRVTTSVSISIPYEKCIRCGYDSVWNPDDQVVGCRAKGGRHSYKRGYTEVFCWVNMNQYNKSLADAFEDFKQKNTDEYEPYKKIIVA